MKNSIALGCATSKLCKTVLLVVNSEAFFLHKKAGSVFWNAEKKIINAGQSSGTFYLLF